MSDAYRKQQNEKTNALWQDFCQKKLHLSKIKDEDYAPIELTGDYKTDISTIKSIVGEYYCQDIRTRFKSFKYRSRTERTTIVISKNTLDQLRRAATELDLNTKTDSYELLFEMILKENVKFSEAVMPADYLSPRDKLRLRLSKDVPLTEKHQWLDLLGWAFEQGWQANSSVKGRKTDKTRNEKLSEFKDELRTKSVVGYFSFFNLNEKSHSLF